MIADAPREFVDANLLVYAFDTSAGAKHQTAAQLLQRLWEQERGVLSVQVLQEFFVTITRKVGKPLPVAQAEERVREFCAWDVFSPTAGDVLEAIAVSQKAKVSFWDAMILHAASESGCAVCWTEDVTHGQVWRGVELRNPFKAP